MSVSRAASDACVSALRRPHCSTNESKAHHECRNRCPGSGFRALLRVAPALWKLPHAPGAVLQAGKQLLGPSEPIVHSSVRAKVEWGEGKSGGLAALAGQPVVLKFAIEEAHLFTFQFE